MSFDIKNEFDKLLDSESTRKIFRVMSNPIVMAILVVIVVLICLWLSGMNYVKISFYIFVMCLGLFMMHDSILIKDLHSETMDSEVGQMISGNVEPRIEITPVHREPIRLFNEPVARPSYNEDVEYI
jgi:hypothetical protein